MSIYVGKGLRGGNGNTATIFGHYLPNDGVLGTDALSYPISIDNPTSTFDVSGIGENHEVPVVLFASSTSISSTVNYTWDWYRRRDNLLVFSFNDYISVPSGQTYSAWNTFAWIGWCADDLQGSSTYPRYLEIQENGDYYAQITTSNGLSSSIDFKIIGIPSSTIISEVRSNSFNWFTRLSNPFSSSNYISAGICTQPFSDGQSYAPSGILDSTTSYSSYYATNGTASNLLSGTTYTIYGFAQAANGLYYRTGASKTITTTGGARPPKWAWTTAVDINGYKVAGENFSMLASEWNNFTANIVGVQRFKIVQPVSTFDVAYTGNDFTAKMYNDAANAIARMTTVNYSTKYAGGSVQADDLNYLMDRVNAI